MLHLKRVGLLVSLWITSVPIFGQTDALYKLEARLMQGDKTALYEIAPYFDSKREVVEFLGYHRLEVAESSVARRIVRENSLFTEDEFRILGSTTAAEFINFLHRNNEKILFSKLTDAFLITPFEDRRTNFEVRKITDKKLADVREHTQNLSELQWVWENKIDSLINEKNPLALVTIASGLFKERYRYNRYTFNAKEFTDLLQLLTGVEIGVPNEKNEITWHIDHEFSPECRLNLLIYFATHYKQFVWNADLSVFSNSTIKIQAANKERILFEYLTDTNNTKAFNAFVELTETAPQKVAGIADEYRDHDLNKNDTIPLFPYRFLKQLSCLTAYCRQNNIHYQGSAALKMRIDSLQAELTFAERYQLENRLIQTLTLEDITAFEYWAAIHEQSWSLTYSAGRILDIFYSKNWSTLVADKKYLECYLKKAKLFDQLGIIGICNNYLKKFIHSSERELQLLTNDQAPDKDIKEQIGKALLLNKETGQKKKKENKEWYGSKDYTISNLESHLTKLTTNVQDSAKAEEAIAALLSKISYQQIGVALKYIADYPFRAESNKYSFLDRDWGFFMAGNFEEKAVRDTFLKNYSRFFEYELYAYYLQKAGIDYRKADQSLDYDKMYEMLKYDVVTAFVGGGGGKQDNEVYSLIKLLELTFRTTLGFPRKLCNSNNMYACYADDRATAWMNYLTDKKLLMYKHDEPVSFNYE